MTRTNNNAELRVDTSNLNTFLKSKPYKIEILANMTK